MKAKKIAEILEGELIGDPEIEVSGPCKIDEGKSGCITFLSNPKYEPHVYSTEASIILVDNEFNLIKEVKTTLIKVNNVYSSLSKLLDIFSGDRDIPDGVADNCVIYPDTTICENASIGDFVVIKSGCSIGRNAIVYSHVYIGKNVTIGKNVILYPGVKIYHGCNIGDDCIIHSNTVIGSDGFGFARDDKGNYDKIPQIGNVVIEDHVEIGANVCIDRATMGSTIIKKGVKLDNLIQVAHNVEIGENTVIAAQTGISGSTVLGENCMIGGQTGFVGHLKIANNTMVQAQSGIAGNVTKENSKLYGYPAIEYQNYLRAYAYFKKLPDIVNNLRELEKKLDKLEHQ